MLGINMGDIGGMTEGDTESFTLTDGIVDISLVPPEHLALCVHVLARAYALLIIGHIRAQESTVVIVGNKAYLLALFLHRQLLVAMRTGYLAHLLFGQVAQREDRALELLFVEHPEEIGLIFLGVGRGAQKPVSVFLRDTRIVAGGDIVAAHLVGQAEHLAPLDGTVAHHTRIRRAPRHIFVDEILNHTPPEGFAKIDNVVLKAHSLSIPLRLHNRVDRAAPFLLGQTRVLHRVIGAESHTHYFVALLL